MSWRLTPTRSSRRRYCAPTCVRKWPGSWRNTVCSRTTITCITSAVIATLASVAITAEGMHVIVVLEQTVLRHEPGHFLTHVGAQYRRRELRVGVRRQLIAAVVNWGRHDHLFLGAVLHGAGGGLKTMPQPADRITLDASVELAQALEHAPAQAEGIRALGLIQQQVVLPGAVLHPPEADDPAHALRLTADDRARRRRSTR